MSVRKLSFVPLGVCALLAVAPSASGQTCGTSLSCTLSGNAFSVTNSTGDGLFGKTSINSNTGNAAGILGVDGSGLVCTVAYSAPSTGIRGESSSHIGVEGFMEFGTAGVAGYAVATLCNPGTGVIADGMLGVHKNNHYYGVFSDGDFGGTGAKYFVEPHPTDAAKEIRYVSLEGPEAGTYFRGTARTVHGRATIEVPESFRLVSAEKGLTVVVTPVGKMATIAVIRKSLERIVVQASEDVEFDYMVNGVRRAYKDFEAISENSDFVPEGPDDPRFFTLPVESQRRLVDNGIYTADGKVNLAKAHEMGWDRSWFREGLALPEPVQANR